MLKIGGSAISDKKTGRSFIKQVAANVASELPKGKKLVIVVGAGYWGHAIAKKYKLFRLDNNQHEWAMLRSVVSRNTHKIIDALIANGHAPIELSANALFILEKGKIKRFNKSIVEGFLERGFLPVIHSDAPLDGAQGLSILSGDIIAATIAKALHAKLLIFGTDVDGVMSSEGKVIRKISKSNINTIKFWSVNDVSGGMREKVKATLRSGVKAVIINLRKKGALKAAFSGKGGTKIG